MVFLFIFILSSFNKKMKNNNKKVYIKDEAVGCTQTPGEENGYTQFRNQGRRAAAVRLISLSLSGANVSFLALTFSGRNHSREETERTTLMKITHRLLERHGLFPFSSLLALQRTPNPEPDERTLAFSTSFYSLLLSLPLQDSLRSLLEAPAYLIARMSHGTVKHYQHDVTTL